MPVSAPELSVGVREFRADRGGWHLDGHLHEEGLLEEELTARLKEWMGFRNVLVHLYLTIDHAKCWATIQNDLGDLDAFAARMGHFLED